MLHGDQVDAAARLVADAGPDASWSSPGSAYALRVTAGPLLPDERTCADLE